MDAVVRDILTELTFHTRRARALVEDLVPDLSFVAYATLSHVYDAGGCRAVDLAAAQQLDKSTVSRQVGELVRSGLLEKTQGGVITTTAAGRRRLEAGRTAQLEALSERLRDWSAEERRVFAELLHRFNQADTPAPQASSRES
jgi:DNA-binding MarR family transcriptional regulator